MNQSEEIKSKKEQIKQLLTDFPEFRSDERALVSQVWIIELHALRLNGTMADFQREYKAGTITSSETITRLKRLIQSDPLNEHLKGIDKSLEESKVLTALEYKTDLFQ